MVDLDKITRNFARSCLLREDVDRAELDIELLMESNLFEAGLMSAQIQSVLEVMENVRLTSNRDRNRMALAKENMKKVRRHVKKIEERVVMLQEQVSLLEEGSKKEKDEGE